MKYGITGGIGSGKTYISTLLQKDGYEVYNCDDEAKRLMSEDAALQQKLKNLIGNDAYIDDKINKPVIAKYLFANKSNAQKVNDIVHPAVKADFIKWSQGKAICFMESAILFESGFNALVDKTILVYAPSEMRLSRAMLRDNATKESILARMKAQISDTEALRMANYIFDNSDYTSTEHEFSKLKEWIMRIKS